MRALHDGMVDLLASMNQPRRNDALLRKTGLTLDRVLSPLLVGLEQLGSVGVGDLADLVGRNDTTVSRQVAKLDGMRFIERRAGETDWRVNEAVLTAIGRRFHRRA